MGAEDEARKVTANVCMARLCNAPQWEDMDEALLSASLAASKYLWNSFIIMCSVGWNESWRVTVNTPMNWYCCKWYDSHYCGSGPAFWIWREAMTEVKVQRFSVKRVRVHVRTRGILTHHLTRFSTQRVKILTCWLFIHNVNTWTDCKYTNQRDLTSSHRRDIWNSFWNKELKHILNSRSNTERWLHDPKILFHLHPCNIWANWYSNAIAPQWSHSSKVYLFWICTIALLPKTTILGRGRQGTEADRGWSVARKAWVHLLRQRRVKTLERGSTSSGECRDSALRGDEWRRERGRRGSGHGRPRLGDGGWFTASTRQKCVTRPSLCISLQLTGASCWRDWLSTGRPRCRLARGGTNTRAL